jgi:hypothetical protein
MLYVGQTFRTTFTRFQEHIREARKVLRRSTLHEDVKPLYAAIAKYGFQSFRCFPIEHIEGNFSNSREFYNVAWPRELFWMRTLHTFFPRGYNLEGKSSLRRSQKLSHKTPMLWRSRPKPDCIPLVSHQASQVWIPRFPHNPIPSSLHSHPPNVSIRGYSSTFRHETFPRLEVECSKP